MRVRDQVTTYSVLVSAREVDEFNRRWLERLLFYFPGEPPMTLREPFEIGSRLLPSLAVGGAELSLEKTRDVGAYGKPCWRWYVDLPNGEEHSAADLCGWEGAQEMFGSFLAFLDACGDGWRCQQGVRKSENADLFPPAVAEWAAANADELGSLRLEIEEGGAVLIED